jgi:hypothetical protein
VGELLIIGFERYMKFFNAAGFATPRVATLALTGNAAPILTSTAMRSLNVCQDAALQRIAATVRESAITRHQMDLERADRRSEALSQLKGTIIDLKSRMERKSGGPTRLTLADSVIQLACKAS